MRVVLLIARKECRELWRDGRFLWTTMVVWLLLLAALLFGWQRAWQGQVEQQHAQAADRAVWLGLGEQNQHDAAHFGRYVFKPQTPLALLDNGVNNYLGIAIWTAAHTQETANFRPAEDVVTTGRFGELTVAVVLQLLLPLVIILFAHATFAGEREAGTLRQLLSLGVAPRALLAGKALGVSVALALLLIPAALLGALAVSVNGQTGGATSLLLLAISYLLYFAVFLALTLAVSALARTSRHALFLLFAFWIVNGFVAPRLAAAAAQSVHPAPKAAEFWEAVNKDLKEGLDGHNPPAQRLEELKQQTLAKYNVQRVEDLPINFEGLSLLAGEEYGDAVFDKHYSRLWRTFAEQNRAQELCAALAPLLAVRSLSMALAGTDFHHHQNFAAQAEAYRRQFVKLLNEDMTRKGGRILATGKPVADRSLWERILEFQFLTPSLRAVLAGQWLNFVMLAAWLGVTSTLAWRGARRLRGD